jgi:decaprenyl-phosphate phosphoribosyltransferase
MSTSLLRGLVRTARPKQWVKNVLVLAAPAAAGRLFEADVAVQTAGAFVTFALASIGTYFANDAADHESDRLHPTKSQRPVAAGIVSVPLAWTMSIVAVALSLGLAVLFSGWQLALLLAGYVTMTMSYSLWLKRVAVIELGCVAAGFVLRMIAGGIATGIPISNWFLTVATFSSLFVVAGKRYAEVLEMGEGSHSSRKVLREYTVSYLRVAWSMALAVSVAAYCQWAFERATTTDTPIWYQLSAVPWVLALLRYALLLERGNGGAPEDVLLSDTVMLTLGALWIAVFGMGIYVH